jgi:hypothetical protein
MPVMADDRLACRDILQYQHTLAEAFCVLLECIVVNCCCEDTFSNSFVVGRCVVLRKVVPNIVWSLSYIKVALLRVIAHPI